MTDNEIKEMLKNFPLLSIEEEKEEDKRDYKLDMVEGLNQNDEIPSEFNLDFSQDLKLQYSIGSCVACAISMNYDIVKDSDEPFSQWFLYANRSEDDFQGEGTRIREVLNHLTDDGIVYLSDFNEVEHYPKIKEILHNKYDYQKLLNKAHNNRSNGYIKLKKNEVKSFIYNEKSPVLVGISIYKNFYDAPYNNGIIPKNPEGEELGGHRVLIVGYKNDILKIANWWGKWGGQDGYLYLDINSNIINDFFALTDKPIKKPHGKKYRIGWDKDQNGKWIYSEDGKKLFNYGWKQVDNDWYFFKENKALENEWLFDNNSWYFLEQNSCKMMKNKWLLWKDEWYYFGNDGKMTIGWFKDEQNQWFYLDNKGKMAVGWLFVGNKWYYLNPESNGNKGKMVTGWLQYNNNYYWLDLDKGYCYTDCTILINDKYYTFDKDGKLVK